MTGEVIAQLILIFGPKAFDLIEKLVAVWTKEMTVDEVLAFTKLARKSYDDYIAEGEAEVNPKPPA